MEREQLERAASAAREQQEQLQRAAERAQQLNNTLTMALGRPENWATLAGSGHSEQDGSSSYLARRILPGENNAVENMRNCLATRAAEDVRILEKRVVEIERRLEAFELTSKTHGSGPHSVIMPEKVRSTANSAGAHFASEIISEAEARLTAQVENAVEGLTEKLAGHEKRIDGVVTALVKTKFSAQFSVMQEQIKLLASRLDDKEEELCFMRASTGQPQEIQSGNQRDADAALRFEVSELKHTVAALTRRVGKLDSEWTTFTDAVNAVRQRLADDDDEDQGDGFAEALLSAIFSGVGSAFGHAAAGAAIRNMHF